MPAMDSFKDRADAEVAFCKTLKDAVVACRHIVRRPGISQMERVGIFVTTLRRSWPYHKHAAKYYGSYRGRIYCTADDPLRIFHLVTDPRFWRDVCLVARPKDHPMINAAAERALAHLDVEEPDAEGSLQVLDGLLNSMNVCLKEQQEHLKVVTETRIYAEKQMQQVLG